MNAAWSQLLPIVLLVVVLIGLLALVYVMRDRSRRELARHRRTDPVAGALTESAFVGELRREVARSARYDFPVAVALIAVDGVRSVNSAKGKDAGNELLRETVKAWRGTLREGDLIGRPGSLAFAVLLPHVSKAGARGTMDRLIALAPPEAAAVGAVVVHEGEESPEAMLRRADAALRHSRRLAGERSPQRPRFGRTGALA